MKIRGIIVLALATLLVACPGQSSDRKKVAPVQVVTATLPDGITGVGYSETLQATGGLPPYTWTVTTGSVPTGLTLDPAGLLSGTPAAIGVFPFTVQVADSRTPPDSATASFSITVRDPLVITTSTLPTGVEGTSYAATLAATGGEMPYTWSIVTGALPAGLSLATTGDITGTPTATGVFPITVEVADSQTAPATVQADFDVIIFTSGANTAPQVTSCTITGPQRGLVDLCYDLADAESSPVFITVEYTRDGGATWQPATAGPGGAGTGPLASAPAPARFLFVWDSYVDIPTGFTLTRLRITPWDADVGVPSESGDFTVDNGPSQEIFVPSATMGMERQYPTATLLQDGRVLVTGGTGLAQVVHATAEVFSPVTGEFSTIANTMVTPRTQHTATLLPDGTVLLAGGLPSVLGVELDSTEIFDPVAEDFTPGPTMFYRRIGHAAVASPTGAYITGGLFASPPPTAYIAEMEEYDMASGTFLAPVNLARERAWHTATLLDNGSIAIVGGGDIYDFTAEEMDPATGSSALTWELTGNLEAAYHRSTKLQDGTVLVTGGDAGRGVIPPPLVPGSNAVYLYTQGIGPVSHSPLNLSRFEHTLVTLADGRALAAGGFGTAFATLDSAEYYDPNSQTFLNTGSMSTARRDHAAVVLTDERAMIIGGADGSATPLATTERYHP